MRVVCAGHVNWDVTFRVDRLPSPDGESHVRERLESGGGSAANVATCLAGLGADARVVGSVGSDEHGERVVGRLRDAGVDTRIRMVDGAETTTKYVLVDDDGEVALLGTDGANEALGPDDVTPSLLDDADALHLTAQRPTTAARLAEMAADRDVPVSFDPGRRALDRDFDAVYECADLVFATDREATAAVAADATVPWAVTTHGPEGATLEGPSGTVTHEGFEVSAPVNSAGAGDAFAAGFLAVWHGDDDSDPERALAVACASGSVAASQAGSRCRLSWDRIEDLL